MDLRAAAIVAEGLAAITAVALARRRSDHWPAAVALLVVFAVAVITVPMNAALSSPPIGPYEGWRRVLVYLDGALHLGSFATVTALALAVTMNNARRAVITVAVAWLLESIALAALYPSPVVRGENLFRIYIATDLFALLVSIGSIGTWAFSRPTPRPAFGVALVLVITDLGILLNPYSPWHNVRLAGHYEVVQLMIAGMFLVTAFVQGVLWRFSAR